MLATLSAGPLKDASRMNWGIWVVLPHLQEMKDEHFLVSARWKRRIMEIA